MQLDKTRILFYYFVREFSKDALDNFNSKPLSRSSNLPTNTRFLTSQLNPKTSSALSPKKLTRLLITDDFYTTKLIRLIHLSLILYPFLRSRRESLITLILAIH